MTSCHQPSWSIRRTEPESIQLVCIHVLSPVHRPSGVRRLRWICTRRQRCGSTASPSISSPLCLSPEPSRLPAYNAPSCSERIENVEYARNVGIQSVVQVGWIAVQQCFRIKAPPPWENCIAQILWTIASNDLVKIDWFRSFKLIFILQYFTQYMQKAAQNTSQSRMSIGRQLGSLIEDPAASLVFILFPGDSNPNYTWQKTLVCAKNWLSTHTTGRM